MDSAERALQAFVGTSGLLWVNGRVYPLEGVKQRMNVLQVMISGAAVLRIDRNRAVVKAGGPLVVWMRHD